MVERVVALVARVEGTFEFEVQPLREYFAATYLFNTAPASPPGNEKLGTRPDRFDALARDFYWLNVTRFFAGCHSKGELPSLVDRLSELMKDDRFRLIAHPRTLALMLLSDWVFSQHPKSVGQVVEMILAPPGLRLVLGDAYSASPDVALPTTCGREQLVDYCFDTLATSPPRDFEAGVCRVVSANADERAARNWSTRVEQADGYERDRWLLLGANMGLLVDADEDWLISMLGENPAGPVLNACLAVGQWRVVEQDETRTVDSDESPAWDGQLSWPSFRSLPPRRDCVVGLTIDLHGRVRALATPDGLGTPLEAIRASTRRSGRVPGR